MSANQTPWPGAVDTRLAGPNWAGQMARWLAADATHGGFAFSGSGNQRKVYAALATASVAGALSAADFSKLAALEVPVSRLVYAAATDVLNGAALTGGTWADVHANQSFTVNSTASLLVISVRLAVTIQSTVSAFNASSRLNIDSGTTLVKLTGGVNVVNAYASPGGGIVLATGLSAGAHTAKCQVIASANATANCRASTQPNYEWAEITIFEVSP